ncbi:unnamed protein product [Lactuca saligna]|uniref:Uncharacterized protein n=1 Tax=Lactuca saligna TaxID=75948 RepID=A0AA35ZEA1_LACSI|nr:unnamed protein product [Lactuca saligna]
MEVLVAPYHPYEGSCDATRGMKHNEAHGTSSIEISSIPTSFILSSTIETTIIDTSTSLPPFSSPITSTLPASTISPTSSNIMHQPITSLFSSQSTKGGKIVPEDEPNDLDVMVSFAETRLKLPLEQIEKQHDDHLKHHARNFEYKVTKLHDVAKERYVIFVEQVKKVEESVNLKVVELKLEMTKEVEKIEKNYSNLHGKVDVIPNAITMLVEYHNSFSTKLDAKTYRESKAFEKLEEFCDHPKFPF